MCIDVDGANNNTNVSSCPGRAVRQHGGPRQEPAPAHPEPHAGAYLQLSTTYLHIYTDIYTHLQLSIISTDGPWGQRDAHGARVQKPRQRQGGTCQVKNSRNNWKVEDCP